MFEIFGDYAEVATGLLVGAGIYAGYLLFCALTRENGDGIKVVEAPQIEPFGKRDMTLQELSEYDGVKQGKRILIAVNGTIFDMSTRPGFYGPGGAYEFLAGHDASRALAKMSTDPSDIPTEYDDLADVSGMERSTMMDWYNQFTMRYPVIGRLLKPGEIATQYNEPSGASSK